MHISRTIMPGALRVAALALVFSIIPATMALAGEYSVVNEPPPMPAAMKEHRAQTANAYGALPVDAERTVRIQGKKVTVRESLGNDVGFAVKDADGDFVWLPAPAKNIPQGLADARELKLKVRELASQLVAGMDPSLRGMVALPTSFVNQEDFSRSSPLGRFIAEHLIYEFNQRGFPVREYRMGTAIKAREGEGEFLLTRKVAPVSVKTQNALFVVGTYYVDRQGVFVNARLVRGNGMVLRTAQLVLPNTAMTRRMLAGGSAGGMPGALLKKGSLPILDYKTTTQPTNLTPIDMGADIH